MNRLSDAGSIPAWSIGKPLHLQGFFFVQQSIIYNGIPFPFGIQLSNAAELQQLLGFVNTCAQSVAQAQKTVPGRISAAGKNLMQIDFTHITVLYLFSIRYAASPEHYSFPDARSSTV